jgi:hypothetical protein
MRQAPQVFKCLAECGVRLVESSRPDRIDTVSNPRPRVAQPERERNETLLGAVVEIALEAPPLRVPSRNNART